MAASCWRATAATLLTGLASVAFLSAQPAGPAGDGEARAVAYLSAEAPRWRREHPCYSCHNNGDAARALFAARVRGHQVDGPLEDTKRWLLNPAQWDDNARRGGSEELPLARIQFASALAAAIATGQAPPQSFDAAATRLLSHQRDDGSWQLSAEQTLGGPTFYGTSLATATARRSLAVVNSPRHASALAKADGWLRSAPTAIVLDASAVLLGLSAAGDPAAVRQRQNALGVLRQAQGADGGVGPYVNSGSEPFDTALALLALGEIAAARGVSPAPFTLDELHAARRKARAYLLSTQNADGSWTETTRPPNGESYAQRVSTTAWALLALMASD